MRIALIVLQLLAGMSLPLLLSDGQVARYLVMICAAVIGVVCSLRLSGRDAVYVWSRFSPFVLLTALPAGWMTFQLAPLGFGLFGHPVWDMASVALGFTMWGHITVDVGATASALCSYLALVVVLTSSIAVGIDRSRAEQLLLVITSVAALTALVLPLFWFGTLPGIESSEVDSYAAARVIAALAVALSLVCADRAFERHETRRGHAWGLGRSYFIWFLLWTAVASGCAICFGVCSSAMELFAAAPGVLLVPAIVGVRRLGLGAWGSNIVAVSFVLVSLTVIAASPGLGPLILKPTSFTYQFTPSPLFSERILADAPKLGNGAGSYRSILQLYPVADDLSKGVPETTAIALASELGLPAFLICILACYLLGGILFINSLRRGRDSFYSILGASAVAILLPSAFYNAGLSAMSVMIIGALSIGLGISQRESRIS